MSGQGQEQSLPGVPGRRPPPGPWVSPGSAFVWHLSLGVVGHDDPDRAILRSLTCIRGLQLSREAAGKVTDVVNCTG